MKNFLKKLLITNLILTSFLILPAHNANAATIDLYPNEGPKDTDLDGLTDQGESEIFHTEPTIPDSDGDGFLDGTEVLVKTNPLDKNDPVIPGTQIQVQTNPAQPVQQNTPWIWYLIRTSGIVGYLFLFFLFITGTGLTTGFIFKLFGPVYAWRIHRTVAITLVAIVTLHFVTLYFDPFMKFSFKDLLIPYFSEFKPLYMALGIIGFYLLVLIILTSLIIIVTKYKAWRFLHYLTFPTFISIFLHGVLVGTDTNTFGMQIVYWFTGSVASLALIYRIIKIPSRKKSKVDFQAIIREQQNNNHQNLKTLPRTHHSS